MPTNRRNVTSEGLTEAVLTKIKHYEANGFPEAGNIHQLIMDTNPGLSPRLWYGMPGYAKSKDSAVLVFFRKDTFITFGITESVDIEILSSDASYLPSSWYIPKFNQAAEELISRTVAIATN